MGWTEISTTHRKANGKADVKAELDELFTWSDNIHISKVLKSQIVRGEFHKSVYYAAVERKEQPYHAAMRTDGTDGREVYCAVVLIEDATDPSMYDFMYKDMDEFAGPIEEHCPASILDLLTETDHEIALEWRNKCRKNAEDKAFRSKLSRLPLGAEIEWTAPEDATFRIGGIDISASKKMLHLTREQYGKTKKWIAYTDFGVISVPSKYLTKERTTIITKASAA